MKRIFVLAAVMSMTALMALAASAAPGDLSLKGGGDSINSSFFGADRTMNFSAQLKADGSVKGHVKVNNVDPINGAIVSKVHGDVVCIVATIGVPAGGQGYEIRYKFKNASGGLALGPYASLYVQDLPGGDLVAEINLSANSSMEDCGLSDALVVWEAVTRGKITVTL